MVNKIPFLLLFLLFSPLILMIFHIIIVRLNNKLFKISISNQLTMIICELVLNIPVLLLVYFLNKSLSAVLYAFIVYNALGYAYFHFFNMSETARRIKILVEIKKQGFLETDRLTQDYESGFMIKTRLRRLIDLNQIRELNGKYFVNSKILLFFAMGINFFRKILNLD